MSASKESSPGGSGPVAQTGRKLGPRAIRTRDRILDATAKLLDERSVLDISVVDIAREVGSSPATFYHYFKDVEEAAVALATRASGEMPDLISLIDGPWGGRAGISTARRIVEAFIQHWDAHHPALMIRNFGAERGDARFQELRRAAFAPLLKRFADCITESQEQGRISKDMHPYAAAAALASILERLAAYHQELEKYGVAREDLVETCARILVQTIQGKVPR